jgi:hypothetical protein
VRPLDAPAAIAGSGQALLFDPVTETQLELVRLGCFTGEVTGKLEQIPFDFTHSLRA